MNTYDVTNLKATLTLLGFGDNSNIMEEIEKAVEDRPDDFVIDTEAFFTETTILSCTLHFHRSTQHNMYFFIKYDAELRYSNNPSANKAQTFYLSNGEGITQKEAFNLLEGRSVNKNISNMDGEHYNAWLQLDFYHRTDTGDYRTRQFRTQFGYDLEKILRQYPIRELDQDEDRVGLIRSLRRGNLQLVHFVKKNKTEKMLIEANPLYKTINIQPARSEPERNESE